MFSEWTAPRAAGERLEDVIRRQWAVPSTHNPPTWERERLSEECTSANAIGDITHPPHLGKQPPPLLREDKYFDSFMTLAFQSEWRPPDARQFRAVLSKESSGFLVFKKNKIIITKKK